MPVVRPFRALRFATDLVDLGRVIAPPYDVIGPEEHQGLLARDPRNVVRLDLPDADSSDVDPDERYRRAARLVATWRGEGVLRQDPRPAVYVYEQRFLRPGSDSVGVRRGFFARVGLEPFGDGVRAHERTLPGPREDRYRLLRATGVNTSPVVAMYEDATRGVAPLLAALSAEPPVVDVGDEAGERHRMWVLTAGTDGRAEAFCRAAEAATLTIADGHHRYETALRYQAERRVGAPGGSGAEHGFDFVLALLLEPGAGPLLVLPTHRVVRGLGAEGLSSMRARLPGLLNVREGVSAGELLDRFGTARPDVAGGGGWFGLWTRDGGAMLRARREAFAPILAKGGPAVRGLDVTLLGAALAACAGLEAAAVASGERLTYTKDAAEAVRLVDAGVDGADAAFLLDATPPSEIIAVATEGDVMPEKSTYIYPKAATGLVINPLEG